MSRLLSKKVKSFFVLSLLAGLLALVPASPALADGSSWESAQATEDNNWFSVAYGDGVWIAVTPNGTNQVMRSTDGGATWSGVAAAEDNGWSSVAYGDGVWIAVSENGTNRVMRSTDGGLNWSAVAATANNGWWSVAYGDGV